MMRRLALPLLALLMTAAALPALAGPLSADASKSTLPVPCATGLTASDLLRLDWRYRRGGVQLACSQGCLRRCAAVYRRCQQRSRDWRRCSSVRRNCIRSCGC
jgi:hypothetical protein